MSVSKIRSVFDTVRNLFVVVGLSGSLFGCSLIHQTNSIQAAGTERFTLNAQMISELAPSASMDLENPGTVLKALLSQIQPEVTIYPSENYYYFGFYDKGLAWSGSLRLAAESRDDGMLQFIYYETFNRWQPSSYGTEVMLGPEDGVTITKLGRFRYKVAYEDVAVVFHLHQLDMTLSPQTILAEGETYVGSLFDESGIGFDLIYSEPMNNFMFLLDTSDAYSERFHDIGDGLVVGKRTGFVYYRDGAYNRSILLGVNYHMSRINSHYDGPFDQLPENYYAEIGFWDYVFKAYPGIKGQVSPYGSFDDETIFAIATYIRYRRISKLDSIRKCIADKGALTQFYQCILDVSND